MTIHCPSYPLSVNNTQHIITDPYHTHLNTNIKLKGTNQMKTITKLFIILSILTIALITNAKPHHITADQLEPSTHSITSDTTQPTSEQFIITKVTDNPTNNDEYYAEKLDGTGVFFNSDYIQSIGQISIGDNVNVFFDQYDELAYVTAN